MESSIADPVRFSGGMRNLTDSVHALGYKTGIVSLHSSVAHSIILDLSPAYSTATLDGLRVEDILVPSKMKNETPDCFDKSGASII